MQQHLDVLVSPPFGIRGHSIATCNCPACGELLEFTLPFNLTATCKCGIEYRAEMQLAVQVYQVVGVVNSAAPVVIEAVAPPRPRRRMHRLTKSYYQEVRRQLGDYHKQCSWCGKVKTQLEFGLKLSSPDRLMPMCEECRYKKKKSA